MSQEAHTSLQQNVREITIGMVEHAKKDGVPPRNLYRKVVDEVEQPLLELMMRYTHGNQSLAANFMGINRATLRTKLKRHNML